MTIVFMLIRRLQVPTAVDAVMLRSSVFRRNADGGMPKAGTFDPYESSTHRDG